MCSPGYLTASAGIHIQGRVFTDHVETQLNATEYVRCRWRLPFRFFPFGRLEFLAAEEASHVERIPSACAFQCTRVTTISSFVSSRIERRSFLLLAAGACALVNRKSVANSVAIMWIAVVTCFTDFAKDWARLLSSSLNHPSCWKPWLRRSSAPSWRYDDDDNLIATVTRWKIFSFDFFELLLLSSSEKIVQFLVSSVLSRSSRRLF